MVAIGLFALCGEARGEPVPVPAGDPSNSAAAVADQEIATFAQTTVKLHALKQPTPEQQAQVITEAGLTVERYNEIAARMQKDAAFQAKVNEALILAQSKALGVAAAAPALPALPTSGVGASVLSVLEKVCLPVVRKDQLVADVGPSAGLKLNKRKNVFTAPLGQAPYSISVLPRGANEDVCNVEIRYPLGQGDEIAKALNIWTMHQQPELKMRRNDVAVGADGLQRTTLSWERAKGAGSAGLVFVRTKRADGAPVEAGVGSATLLFSEQPNSAATASG
jgi:hypothetical protein